MCAKPGLYLPHPGYRDFLSGIRVRRSPKCTKLHQDTQNYFDAQFPSLCKPGFLDERLEVKAGMYGNSITDTSVKGGAGGFGLEKSIFIGFKIQIKVNYTNI